MDRDRWTAVPTLRALSILVVNERPRADDTTFPANKWWLDLSTEARDIPPAWTGFDLADVIIAEGISFVTVLLCRSSCRILLHFMQDPDDTEKFHNNVVVLANDLGTLEKEIEKSTEGLQAIEDELAIRMSEALPNIS